MVKKALSPAFNEVGRILTANRSGCARVMARHGCEGDLAETTRRPGTKPKAQRQGASGNAAAIAAAERAEAEKHPGLLARTAAAAILQDIVAKGHLLEERFSSGAVPNRLGALDARDRGLTRSIVTAALRRLGTIRASLARFMEGGLPRQVPDLEWTLIVGAAQVLLLDVPDHAAVDLAVRAVRLDRKTAPFAALVNAVLRNIARARRDPGRGGRPRAAPRR